IQFFRPSISAACLRVVSVILTPPSIRAISSTRSSLPSTVTRESTRSFEALLKTCHCWSAEAATCGRWVMHITWCLPPSCFNIPPTAPRTAPADAGVHFVEHERGHARHLRRRRLYGKRKTRQLSAGGNPGERSRLHAFVGGYQELDALQSGRCHLC